MLAPKRIKFRKQFKGRTRGIAGVRSGDPCLAAVGGEQAGDVTRGEVQGEVLGAAATVLPGDADVVAFDVGPGGVAVRGPELGAHVRVAQGGHGILIPSGRLRFEVTRCLLGAAGGPVARDEQADAAVAGGELSTEAGAGTGRQVGRHRMTAARWDRCGVQVEQPAADREAEGQPPCWRFS